MGLDARIWIGGVTEFDDEFLREAGHFLSNYDHTSQVAIYNMVEGISYIEGEERFFSEGYPRGDWLMIRAAIMLCQKRFPDSEIRYGSDHDDDWDDARLANTALLQHLDTVWMEDES